jgi:hypothetical protein
MSRTRDILSSQGFILNARRGATIQLFAWALCNSMAGKISSFSTLSRSSFIAISGSKWIGWALHHQITTLQYT